MSKVTTILLSVGLSISLAGCSPSPSNNAPDTNTPPQSESYQFGYEEGLQVANPANGQRAGGVELACNNILSIDKATYSDIVESDYLAGCRDAWMSLADQYGE